MKKSDWRYLVDALLFICLGGMTLIGILLGLVVPTGPVASEASKYFLGLHRHQWGNIHAYLSIAFVVLIIVHIVLNWRWVTAKTAQIFRRRPASLLVAGASIPFFVLLVFWLFTPKDAGKYRDYGIESSERAPLQKIVKRENIPVAAETSGTRELPANEKSSVEMKDRKDIPEKTHHQAVGSLDITGRNTLLDIERATGISATVIADKLGMPPETNLNETLGRLRRRYGFEIQEVRDLVERFLKQKKP